MEQNEITAEQLGPEATEADLDEFREFVARLRQRQPELTQGEAIDMVWGHGDYYKNARELGLLEEETN